MPGTKLRYVPHRTLRDGSTFVSLPDTDYVLEVRTIVQKVSRIMGADDKPAMTPTGEPAFSVQSSTSVSLLTKEEWNVRKKMEDGPA